MIPAKLDVQLEDWKKTAVNQMESEFYENDCSMSNNQLGFWWAWNSCLTKKWRTPHTGMIFLRFIFDSYNTQHDAQNGLLLTVYLCQLILVRNFSSTGVMEMVFCRFAGDEAFLDKVLKDFRTFCSNADNRLYEFWQSCRRSSSPSILEDLSPDTTFDIVSTSA